MLKISVSQFNRDIHVIDIDEHFMLAKKPEWFKDPFVRKVIREIDKSEVTGDDRIESPVFGDISTVNLSTGCKALIIMRMQPEFIVYATRCGDNCAPYILELAENQDLRILLHHCMEFPENVHAVFVESGIEVKGYHDYIYAFYDTVEEVRKRELFDTVRKAYENKTGTVVSEEELRRVRDEFGIKDN